MTPAGIGPILSGVSLPSSARDEDPSSAAAFEAALDDTKSADLGSTPAVASTGAASTDGTTSGVVSPSLSPSASSVPTVPTAAADIIALATRAADQTAAGATKPTALAATMATASPTPTAVIGGSDDVGSSASGRTRQRSKSSDTEATVAVAPTDGTVLSSMLAFMPAQPVGRSTSGSALPSSSDAPKTATATPLPRNAASVPGSATEEATTTDAQESLVTPAVTARTGAAPDAATTTDGPAASFTLPADTIAANPTKTPSVLTVSSSPIVAPATPATASVATQTAVESAIEPGSVQISTHLGFSRGLPQAPSAGSANRTVSAKPASGAIVEDDEQKPEVSGSDEGIAGAQPQAAATSRDETVTPTGTAASGKSADAIVPDASASAQASPLVRRIADGVAALAATAATAPASTVLSDPSTRQILPARTMDLQLAPAGLGTLSVRLHVSGRSLDVTLEASDAGTAAVIDRDRSSLADALAGRDLNLQTLSVTTQDATRDTTMQGAPYGSGGDTSGSDRPASGGSGSSGQGAAGRQPGGQDGRQTRGGDAPRVERADPALFV